MLKSTPTVIVEKDWTQLIGGAGSPIVTQCGNALPGLIIALAMRIFPLGPFGLGCVPRCSKSIIVVRVTLTLTLSIT